MTDFLTTRYTVLTTELGRFLMWSNGQRTTEDGRVVDQIGFRTEQAHNLPARGSDITADDVDASVTVNRVEWRYHSFATLDAETGDIVTYSSDDWRANDAHRVDWKDAPYESKKKAETKIEAAIRPALEAWAKTPEARDFMRAGRYFAANNDAHSLERDMREAEAKVAEIKAKLDTARGIMAANRTDRIVTFHTVNEA